MISPIDDRYYETVAILEPIFGENSLIAHRVDVEINWIRFLSKIGVAPLITPQAELVLISITDNGFIDSIKSIEKLTKHDIKSIELYISSKLKDISEPLAEYVHFACTSEDISNVAYAIMIKKGVNVLRAKLQSILDFLQRFAEEYASLPMLSRTHGQPATPTTLGKEFANFAFRIHRQLRLIDNFQYLAKMNGAVGNFNAHHIAYPDLQWNKLIKEFLNGLGLTQNVYTTQIEPHDWISEISDTLARINTILIGFCRDMWYYVSINYFKQTIVNTEVGSSTMPHKINPIYFENAEGNFGVANSLFRHFSEKLPISRLQRDLSDSTVMRNIGVAFSHSLIAYDSIFDGLNRVSPNRSVINDDLYDRWEVLSESFQILLRKNGFSDAYEKLKNMTRTGNKLSCEDVYKLIDDLNLPQDFANSLRFISPGIYVGLAPVFASDIKKYCSSYK